MKSVQEQLSVIKRGADEVLVEAELITKLERGLPLYQPASYKDPAVLEEMRALEGDLRRLE